MKQNSYKRTSKHKEYYVGMEHDHIIIDENYSHLIEEIKKVDKKFKIKTFKSYDKAIDYLVRHMTDVDLIRFGMYYKMNPRLGKMVKSNPNYMNRKEYKELMAAYAEAERYFQNVMKVEMERHNKKVFDKKLDNEEDEFLDIQNSDDFEECNTTDNSRADLYEIKIEFY